jgi:hypothetical protein
MTRHCVALLTVYCRMKNIEFFMSASDRNQGLNFFIKSFMLCRFDSGLKVRSATYGLCYVLFTRFFGKTKESGRTPVCTSLLRQTKSRSSTGKPYFLYIPIRWDYRRWTLSSVGRRYQRETTALTETNENEYFSCQNQDKAVVIVVKVRFTCGKHVFLCKYRRPGEI